MTNNKVGLIVAPETNKFDQRESNVSHTSTAEENAFYKFVTDGNVENIARAFDSLLEKGIVAGKLSKDPLRQSKYWAVASITLGTRAAIAGGLDEMEAFNLSDEYIRTIDEMNSTEEIMRFIGEKVLILTQAVRDSRGKNCPKNIRVTINYIEKHLHENISVKDLAALSGYSENHFTRLFSKYLGKTPKQYILARKLEESKLLLLSGYSVSKVVYTLSFCSQSAYIALFKKAYGETPKKFVSKE